MKIKCLQIRDIDDALLLVRRFKNSEAGREALESFLAHNDHYLIGAFAGDAPVGFAIAYELNRTDTGRPMIYIHDIEVDQAYRRQGIGRRLMESLHEICCNRKALKMFVITGSDNLAAMSLYRAAGGKQLADSDAVFEFRY